MQQPDITVSNTSLFILRDLFDPSDELEVSWQLAYQKISGIPSLSERDAMLSLQAKVNKGEISDVISGLLYGILTDTHHKELYLKWLTVVSRDGFSACIRLMTHLITEKFPKLSRQSRIQSLWLVTELVKMNVQDVKDLCSAFVRNIIGGDLSEMNIMLCTVLLQLFIEQKAWLYSSGQASLIPILVYTFLRLIFDHSSADFLELRDTEISFCLSLLRDKFKECQVIGRDLIRLISQLNKIPEIAQFWKDLTSPPNLLQSSVNGSVNNPNIRHQSVFDKLLTTPTPPIYFQSRLTPEMEHQLLFILTQVKFGNQKRYQQWFTNKFLSRNENETLLSDLIRYICGSYHPSNRVLCSDIVPRWAAIGWLLKCVKTQSMLKHVHLALFYDWLYFDPQYDNIMNIEPAMLLMFNSIPKYHDITSGLFNYIFYIIEKNRSSQKRLDIERVFEFFQLYDQERGCPVS